MREATDVRGGDSLGRPGVERGQLVVPQLTGKRRLQDRVRAGRSAAQVRIGNGNQLAARSLEHRFHLAAHLLAVLQAAGRMEGHLGARDRGCAKKRRERGQLCSKNLGQVQRERRDTLRLCCVGRIVAQQVAILLDRRPAPAGRHHDRLRTGLHMGPPGIDQRAHVVLAVLLAVQVEPNRPAATGPCSLGERDAEPVEYPGGGGIDRRGNRRLHATREHKHFAGVARRGPFPCGSARGRDLVLQRRREQRPHGAAERQQPAKDGRVG